MIYPDWKIAGPATMYGRIRLKLYDVSVGLSLVNATKPVPLMAGPEFEIDVLKTGPEGRVAKPEVGLVRVNGA